MARHWRKKKKNDYKKIYAVLCTYIAKVTGLFAFSAFNLRVTVVDRI